jgi:hypothetical protein
MKKLRMKRRGGFSMNTALNSIGIILERIFGPEGASLLVDDLRIALAMVEPDDAAACRGPVRELNDIQAGSGSS